MIITTGRYDRTTGQVTVVFEEGELRHERQVNACLKEDGTHDRKATMQRVEEVALGVAVKMGLGVIAAPVGEAGDLALVD
jgi:hypothetical protein